jgi:hypothetical protein
MPSLGKLRRIQFVVGIAVTAAILAFLFRDLIADAAVSSWNQAIDWGVSPVIFLVLLFGTTFHYYKGWFLIAKGVFKKDADSLRRGVILNRAMWAIPWIYVVAFGHDYPSWIIPVGCVTFVLLTGWFIYNYRRPEYIHRMTRSPFGRFVGRKMGLNDEGEERHD